MKSGLLLTQQAGHFSDMWGAMHRETATELSAEAMDIDPQHWVWKALPGFDLGQLWGIFIPSFQEFMVFILIAGLCGAEQIILKRRIFSPTFTSLSQRSISILAVFVCTSNFWPWRRWWRLLGCSVHQKTGNASVFDGLMCVILGQIFLQNSDGQGEVG